jgi:UDP-N-acetylglucosamine 4-epimerase
MARYDQIRQHLAAAPRTWLVTGAAGFIGSHLVEALLGLEQKVVGLDNLSTGNLDNLAQVEAAVGERQWRRFRFLRGDIRSLDTCRRACVGIEVVLHHAALGSVPASLEDPLGAHASNVTGFLNMLVAAQAAGASRFVYASSSAAYGDDPASLKTEPLVGQPLSPYAATKFVNEIYAGTFARCYRLDSIGLRYFNIFGPRQDPAGAYAAVIPAWIWAMIRGESVFINGDGETVRDFCYVADVVQANLLAATVDAPTALNQSYNVALNAGTTLNQLFELIRTGLEPRLPQLRDLRPQYREFRDGDIRRSQADIGKAARLLGYLPQWSVGQGLARTLDWYLDQPAKKSPDTGGGRLASGPAGLKRPIGEGAT